MGISCRNGGTYADNSTCRTDGSRDFRGVVTPELRAFEDRVLRTHFHTTIAQWENDSSYHAYHLMNVISVGRTTPMERIWHEFARRPAPSITTRGEPVKNGERGLAMAAPTLGRGFGMPIPLPGGPVVHYVDKSVWALINATVAPHVLHPGHILRWFVQTPGSEIECHTVGRGTTMLTSLNETLGLEIFDELDLTIRSAISRH